MEIPPPPPAPAPPSPQQQPQTNKTKCLVYKQLARVSNVVYIYICVSRKVHASVKKQWVEVRVLPLNGNKGKPAQNVKRVRGVSQDRFVTVKMF